MDQSEKVDRLNAIVDRFYTRPTPRGLLSFGSAPFDISKPNKHDDKQAFTREKKAVEAALEHVEGLLSALLPAGDPSERDILFHRELRATIDSLAAKHVGRDQPDSIPSFLGRVAVDAGLSAVTLFCLVDMATALREQRQELVEQEAEFWTVSNRPPNHYARKIALRFARAIARNTGKKPTFGMARDGNHPSTDFGRALEEVYVILGIKAQVKNAAIWALAQLTEEDFKPAGNALAAFGSPFQANNPSTENMQEIVNALMRKAPPK